MSNDYRQQYQAEVDQSKRQNEIKLNALLTAGSSFAESAVRGADTDQPIAIEQPDIAKAFEILKDQSKPEGLRIAALSSLRIAAGEDREIFDYVVNLLGDNSQNQSIRVAVLNLLKQLGFSSSLFPSSAGKIANILRGLANGKQVSQELRESAIGFLARQNDEYVQSLLAEGLKSPDKAVVAPLKALRWLSADSHYRDATTLRTYVTSQYDDETRELAVRLLAQDPQSKPLLTELLRNKEESPVVRRACAVAIQVLDPADYSNLAREIVLDSDDDGDVRACLLNGLSFETSKNESRGLGFKEAVQKLLDQPNDELRKSSEMYLKHVEE